MRYPSVPRADIADVLHGHLVADPYRGLEDAAAPETHAWSAAQDELWEALRRSLPERSGLADRVRDLLPGSVSLPEWRGDRAFASRRELDQEHAVLFERDADGRERPLVDPNALSPDFTTTLDAAVASPDGRLLAYQLSAGGDEESVLRVLDVDTGALVDGPIERCRYSPVAWLADGRAFYYVRKLSAAEAPDGDGNLHRRVFLHRLGADWHDDALVFGGDSAKGTYFGLNTSVDGRWLLVSAAVGTAPRNDLWLADLTAAPPEAPVLREVQRGVDAQTDGEVLADGALYLHTDLGAPRGRIVIADPKADDLGPAGWRDLIPEAAFPLTDWAVTEDAIVAVHLVDVASRVTVHDRASGQPRREVPLPGLGDVMVSSRPGGVGADVWLAYTDTTTPATVYRVEVGTAERTTWAVSPGAPALPPMATRRVFVTSADGTRVPLFVTARTDLVGGPRPTVLYGYGGFNNALTPAYSARVAAWVEAGGVWANACLRGGSEYGEEWHRAGMRERKQNVFDDFFACAEWLITEGITERDRLGIMGGSNGGLLVGAALTQRPDLFRAVVCSAPLLDMVRYEQFGLGQTWNDEYGTAADPTELGWLLGYSPYHRVVQGTRYPAVLFSVFDNDTRVDPFHARKLCAALQWATSADPATHPVLYRRERDVGHGQRSVGRTVAMVADELGFLAWALRLGAPGSAAVG